MAKTRKDNHSSKPNPENDRSYLKYSGIAFELVAFNLVCIWGGYKLNEYVSPKIPWILIIAVFISVAGSIYYLLKRLNS